MSDCRKIQGAMAASLYEPLGSAEQQALAAHLQTCSACRAEFEGFQVMAAMIPVEPVCFEGNLLPSIRASLHAAPSQSRRWAWSVLSLAFSSVFVVFGLFVYFYMVSIQETNPLAEAPSPAVLVLDEVAALLAADDAPAAMAVLERARDKAESTELKGRYALEMANLEFDSFRRYPDAYDIYNRVRIEYSTVWAQSDPQVKDRFDLLTEARDHGFEALYQIDSARSQGESGMSMLEQVMARYPGRSVAREALSTMVALVEGEGVDALENVKSQCTNPVAVAQLDVHLGERYWAERLNPELGRQLLQGVAGSEYEVPAKMAKDTLARLEQSGE